MHQMVPGHAVAACEEEQLNKTAVPRLAVTARCGAGSSSRRCLYDIANVEGVTADLSHCKSATRRRRSLASPGMTSSPAAWPAWTS